MPRKQNWMLTPASSTLALGITVGLTVVVALNLDGTGGTTVLLIVLLLLVASAIRFRSPYAALAGLFYGIAGALAVGGVGTVHACDELAATGGTHLGPPFWWPGLEADGEE